MASQPFSVLMSWMSRKSASMRLRWSSGSAIQASHSASGLPCFIALKSSSANSPRAAKYRASIAFGICRKNSLTE
jgi:hypothetical protein